jgi:hypothetical protein
MGALQVKVKIQYDERDSINSKFLRELGQLMKKWEFNLAESNLFWVSSKSMKADCEEKPDS